MTEGNAVNPDSTPDVLACTLAQASALFEHLQEALALNEVVCNEQGDPVDYRILEVNSRFERQTGLRRVDVARKLASQVYGPEQPSLLPQFTAVGNGAATRRVEVYFPALRRKFQIAVVPFGRRIFATILADCEQLDPEPSEQRTTSIALLDSLPFLVWFKDPNGRYLAANRAFLNACGHETMDTILGKTSLRGPGSMPLLAQLEDEVDVSSYSQRSIEAFVPELGEARVFEITWTPVYAAGGRLMGASGMARDITEGQRAEQARIESERKFMQVFDLAPDAISVTSPEGEVLYANRAFSQLVGYSVPELMQHRVTELGIWQQPESRAQAVSSLMQFGHFERLEVKLTSRTGQNYCVECSAVLSEFEGRRVMIQALRDMTQQRLAEERARRASETLAQYFELIPDPLCIATRDARFSSLNPAWERVLGWSIAELQQSSFLDFIHPDDIAATRAVMKHLDAGQAVIDFRNRYRHVDGRWRWLEWRSVQDGHGNIYGVARDVTVRIQEEEALRAAERAASKSREQLLRVSELAQIGHFVIELETRQTTWTAELYRILGIMHEAMPSLEGLRRVLNEEDAVLFDRAIACATQTGVAQRLRLRVLRPNGECRHCLTIIERDTDVSGVIRILGLVQDLTDLQRSEESRRKLEQQVMLSQKLESLGVLAGGIAHDFNNLLTSILGNVELALTDLDPQLSACSYLRDVETVGRRAADLCRQMLAYSGKGRFVVQSLSLNDLVREMAHLLGVSISKKVTLKYQLATGLPSIVADVTQIRQIVMNLITNASEAIPDEGGTITLSTEALECSAHDFEDVVGDAAEHAPGHYVSLEVRDTGCGMDTETLGRIFDPFFTTKFTGRGLGLAAVLGIVRGHHGALRVRSTPRVGTTFQILLPAFEIDARALDGPKSELDDWKGSGLVLLVDDEESIRQMGRNLLERAGFEVLCASDGEEALSLYATNPAAIRLVILDMTMPRMDGEACFRALRRIRPDVQVILSSGYDEQSVVQGFVEQGLAGFLQKPYNASDLLPKIRQVLGGE